MTLLEIVEAETRKTLADLAKYQEQQLIYGPVPVLVWSSISRHALADEEVRMIFLRMTPSWMWR